MINEAKKDFFQPPAETSEINIHPEVADAGVQAVKPVGLQLEEHSNQAPGLTPTGSEVKVSEAKTIDINDPKFLQYEKGSADSSRTWLGKFVGFLKKRRIKNAV